MISFSQLPKWAIAGLAFPLICLNGWLLYWLGGILQPATSIAITASVIAFLLDYPIDWLENRGLARGLAVALVVVLAGVVTTVLVVFLGPQVWQQLNDFAERLPGWIDQAKTQLLLLEDRTIFQNLPIDLDQLTVEAANQLTSALQATTTQAISVTLSTLDSALNLLITVVLAILLVINGDPLWEGLLSWLPARWQAQIRSSLRPSFQGYFSGQATLALILAVAQSTALILLKVPFGLLFGLVIGLISIIPFGGTVAVLGISTLLAFQDVWLALKVLGVAIVLGQINDNLVAPRLMGGITGLNPAMIILVLLIGSKFAGFLGLLLAVPTASFVKKIVDSTRQPGGEEISLESLDVKA
ncbi:MULTISPECIES: AI-2E family transporter [Cyanophyceae]|uniref:AI-2E family transporter n=1 Tax=Cyanophyceae TaxID=3028117 RepID=UPI0016861B18|nr:MULTISPECIES: AI-2E family transporter [Cyanophyceae]MBD1914619.1 AI-2E family transporter [Phormidium sp. FACHB-77]MBD2031002.1 AI-2E family transporter [Phormidium sp. FACHB-322]MBD2052609.1 AI-2E family transporter [Leptolyngbya sp. FACHB-60]